MSGGKSSDAAGVRLGREPSFRELGLVGSLLSGGESAEPTNKCGRVRKNRRALKVPERAKRVAARRVTWYATWPPEWEIQRERLFGTRQTKFTAGY